MSVYDSKPWLSRYDPDQPTEISPEFTDALSMFRASVDRNPDGDLIRYFGGRITARELDELSDAFAVVLLGLGVRAGDRVALYLQNVPQFVIGLLATWKAGGVAVPVNPMNRARELDAVLRDSGARVLVCLQSLYRDVAAAVVSGCRACWSTSATSGSAKAARKTSHSMTSGRWTHWPPLGEGHLLASRRRVGRVLSSSRLRAVSPAPPGSGGSPLRGGPRPAWRSDTYLVDPFERRRSMDGRMVTRREALAQAVTERALELVVSALDMNALLDRSI